jgi:hypothetical protein
MTNRDLREVAAMERALTFKCLGYTKCEDGLIERYHLKVTERDSGRIETIAVDPKHLASARSMKRILLDRCIFYKATRTEHDEMLLAILNPV